MINNINYESSLRSCVRDFSKVCLNRDLTPDILTAKISTIRIYLDDILTTYSDEVPFYINKKLDMLLQYELSVKHIIPSDRLPRLRANEQISLYKGDITTIESDCIVNGANASGIGCFTPGHKCIDNIIHSKAGPRLRAECRKKMNQIGLIQPGNLITTLGYNLPSRYVFHVVGPIYDTNRIKYHESILTKAYINCLDKLREMGLRSIVFCCISTGEYDYPKHPASVVAVQTVNQWLLDTGYPAHVIFCVYTIEDLLTYETTIGTYL